MLLYEKVHSNEAGTHELSPAIELIFRQVLTTIEEIIASYNLQNKGI
jgi:hypothetical protein